MFTRALEKKLALDLKQVSKKTYDVIIVGAGPCGALIARKILEAEKEVNVLLIEAGGYHNVVYGQHIQNMQAYDTENDYSDSFTDHSFNPPSNNIYHCGKGLGGSTITNGAVWVNPKADFERWAKKYNLPAWSKNLDKKILEIKKLLTPNSDSAIKNETIHKIYNNLSTLFSDASKKSVRYTSVISNNGERRDVFASLLEAYYNDSRLTILSNTHAKKIEFKKVGTTWMASALVCEQQGTSNTISLAENGQMICTAGAVGTPVLLQRSGIMPKKQSVSEQVMPVLPVGQHLSVHHNFLLFAFFQPGQEIDASHRTNMDISIFTPGLAKNLKALNLPPQFKAQIFVKRDENAKPIGLIVGVFALDNNTQGCVTLTDSDEVLIQTGKNPTQQDKENFKTSFLIANEVMTHLAEAGFVEYKAVSEEEVTDEILSKSYYTEPHFVGTCKIGEVLETNFTVKQTQNLLIGDASILPAQSHGNTLAAAMVGASYCADEILNRFQPQAMAKLNMM